MGVKDFTKVFEHWTIWIAVFFAVVAGGIKGVKSLKRTMMKSTATLTTRW
jgi:hypothetical protein